MDVYSIYWKSSAVKDLRKLHRQAISRVIEAVEALSSNPFHSGVRKMQGSEHSYRLRVGDYRVVYTVFESDLVIEVVRVRHRKDVYRT